MYILKKIVMIGLLALVACSENNIPVSQQTDTEFKDNSMQGDMVVWQISPNLIIKTFAGEKNYSNQLLPLKSPFLGQFPINYQPKKQKLIEADQIENVANFQHPMQFNLLLNGAKNVPINGFHDKNFKNQVKVEVQNRTALDPIAVKYKRTPRQWIAYLKSTGYSKNEKLSKAYDLECYTREDLPVHLLPSDQCIGFSNNVEHSEFILKIYRHVEDDQIMVEIETLLYPNTKINWRVPVGSLKDWKKIDKNIWRLLAAWNVK